LSQAGDSLEQLPLILATTEAEPIPDFAREDRLEQAKQQSSKLSGRPDISWHVSSQNSGVKPNSLKVLGSSFKKRLEASSKRFQGSSFRAKIVGRYSPEPGTDGPGIQKRRHGGSRSTSPGSPRMGPRSSNALNLSASLSGGSRKSGTLRLSLIGPSMLGPRSSNAFNRSAIFSGEGRRSNSQGLSLLGSGMLGPRRISAYNPSAMFSGDSRRSTVQGLSVRILMWSTPGTTSS